MKKERVVFLDSGPLGRIIHPRPSQETEKWILFVSEQKIALRIAEITDYELRRNLILEGLTKSINNLNKYRQRRQFICIDSATMLNASEIWAELHGSGQGTSNMKNIDADVILAAQALSLKDNFEEVIILTENPKHIFRFNQFSIKTWDWKQAIHDCKYGSINFYQAPST